MAVDFVDVSHRRKTSRRAKAPPTAMSTRHKPLLVAKRLRSISLHVEVVFTSEVGAELIVGDTSSAIAGIGSASRPLSCAMC